MDKSAIDTPSREIDRRNIPVHLRTALRRALEFEARAPAPRSAEEAEQCEEQLRAIADEFFGALLTPVLQRAVRSAAVGDAASALVRHLPRRMRSDGLETVNVRTSRGTADAVPPSPQLARGSDSSVDGDVRKHAHGTAGVSGGFRRDLMLQNEGMHENPYRFTRLPSTLPVLTWEDAGVTTEISAAKVVQRECWW